MNIYLILNGYQNRAVWLYKYQYKSTVNGNKKEKLLTVNFTIILISCLNDKFVTVYDKYVTNLSTAMQFATCVSSVCLMHPPPFFCTLCYSRNPHKQKSNKSEKSKSWTVNARFKHLHLDNHSELDTCSDKLFSHNDQYYHLSIYLSLLLNHPVHERPDGDLAQ